jgi:hypothetical protein
LHLFDDIIAKGVTRNYNTKPYKKLHGPFKWHYVSETNNRDVDEQVCSLGCKWRFLLISRQLLRLDHLEYTICFIRSKIEILDDMNQSNNVEETAELPSSTSTPAMEKLITHIYIGSAKKETTVAEFADGPAGNGPAYPVFRRMLETFLNQFYRAHQLPHEKYLGVQSNQKVISGIPFIKNGY